MKTKETCLTIRRHGSGNQGKSGKIRENQKKSVYKCQRRNGYSEKMVVEIW
ncbi:MAG: hypothetical protein M8350_08105 [Methanosarcinaceae archaeon]|nr:hypothetical protein [Methanosarcinaceae archaeon]